MPWLDLQTTREGLQSAALFTLRLATVVTAAALLTLTTSPLELTDGLELELSWEGDTLQVDAGHPVGADLWAGGTRRVIVGEGETMAIRPVDDRIGIFEDWLD